MPNSWLQVLALAGFLLVALTFALNRRQARELALQRACINNLSRENGEARCEADTYRQRLETSKRDLAQLVLLHEFKMEVAGELEAY